MSQPMNIKLVMIAMTDRESCQLCRSNASKLSDHLLNPSTKPHVNLCYACYVTDLLLANQVESCSLFSSELPTPPVNPNTILFQVYSSVNNQNNNKVLFLRFSGDPSSTTSSRYGGEIQRITTPHRMECDLIKRKTAVYLNVLLDLFSLEPHVKQSIITLERHSLLWMGSLDYLIGRLIDEDPKGGLAFKANFLGALNTITEETIGIDMQNILAMCKQQLKVIRHYNSQISSDQVTAPLTNQFIMPSPGLALSARTPLGFSVANSSKLLSCTIQLPAPMSFLMPPPPQSVTMGSPNFFRTTPLLHRRFMFGGSPSPAVKNLDMYSLPQPVNQSPIIWQAAASPVKEEIRTPSIQEPPLSVRTRDARKSQPIPIPTPIKTALPASTSKMVRQQSTSLISARPEVPVAQRSKVLSRAEQFKQRFGDRLKNQAIEKRRQLEADYVSDYEKDSGCSDEDSEDSAKPKPKSEASKITPKSKVTKVEIKPEIKKKSRKYEDDDYSDSGAAESDSSVSSFDSNDASEDESGDEDEEEEEEVVKVKTPRSRGRSRQKQAVREESRAQRRVAGAKQRYLGRNGVAETQRHTVFRDFYCSGILIKALIIDCHTCSEKDSTLFEKIKVNNQ